MKKPAQQSTLFRGIYEFEDPSGTLLAAKVPATGSVDLYADTAIIVRPNQTALFLYKGEIGDLLNPGTHRVQTENLPLLTRLANWRFGFQSPLRCELIYFSLQQFKARRWGTARPILAHLPKIGTVPIRSYGNFSVSISNPEKFYLKVMGTRSVFSVVELDDFIQGQIVELMPNVLQQIQSFEELSASLDELSKSLEALVKREIAEFGISVQKIQILSALPSQEVIEAMEAKTAMKILGSQKEYLLYKAASSLSLPNDGTKNDPLQMMMGLMLGKGLLGVDSREKEKIMAPDTISMCSSCGAALNPDARFCSSCGKRVAL